MTLLQKIEAGVDSSPSLSRPAGIEISQELEPAGGMPVFPPVYEGRVEINPRHIRGIDGEVLVVELDSVGSSANRVESVLAALHKAGDYPLPVSDTKVSSPDGEPIVISTLEGPHRLFDAWIRLSASDDPKINFEDSELGQELSYSHISAVDAILEVSAHDLLFGTWDSHRKGPHGQVRIARSITGTLIGLNPIEQSSFAARRDPINLGDSDESKASGAQKLSELGLSSIPPQKQIPYEEDPSTGRVKTFGATGKNLGHRGGISITSARYDAFISFPALRRLGFERYDAAAARTMLAMLGVYGTMLRCAEGWDLRSRCVLTNAGVPSLNLVLADGTRERVELDLDEARKLFDEAVKKVGVKDRSVHLDAGERLNSLVANSVAAEKKKDADKTAEAKKKSK